MKVKKIMLGVKDGKQIANRSETRMTLKKKEAQKDKKLCFENIKELRKAITPKRIELLHIAKKMKPKSMQELARILNRDIKSIAMDLHLLGKLGLIDMKRKTEGRKEARPVVDYNKISLEIVI
ncbi:MAG: hypothetical protein E3K37_11270 [Candidatus Kuenenia sp.]|nr:hypothetical protein [Candidatus Kuenenia hertensis]